MVLLQILIFVVVVVVVITNALTAYIVHVISSYYLYCELLCAHILSTLYSPGCIHQVSELRVFSFHYQILFW